MWWCFPGRALTFAPSCPVHYVNTTPSMVRVVVDLGIGGLTRVRGWSGVGTGVLPAHRLQPRDVRLVRGPTRLPPRQRRDLVRLVNTCEVGLSPNPSVSLTLTVGWWNCTAEPRLPTEAGLNND
jgi:hypothetical protein